MVAYTGDHDPGREDEAPRCLYTYGQAGPQCCRERGHEGPHRFKCAARGCPGRPMPASQLRHPADCGEPKASLPPAPPKSVRERARELDADGWRQADAIANRRVWLGPQDFTIGEAMELLRERDRIALSLSDWHRRCLEQACTHEGWAVGVLELTIFEELEDVGLVERPPRAYARATSFGREMFACWSAHELDARDHDLVR